MLCELVAKGQPRQGLFDYVVDCAEMAIKAKPGQFLHILCGGNTYLRRPISICDVVDNRLIRFIFEVRGEGTKALSEVSVGERLDILGPLGSSFDVNFKDSDNADSKIESDESNKNIDIPDGEIILIGGGIGIFPLFNLAKSLPKKPMVMLGFRDMKSVVLTGEFSTVADSVFIASDDGSVGHDGFVTDLLKNTIDSGKKIARIYTCGPKPMMKIVADIAKENNIQCQISMEERMGCGVGACVTCTCTMSDGTRKRVCKDGPIFNASEVDFDG